MYFQSPLNYHIKRKLHHDATNDRNKASCALLDIRLYCLSTFYSVRYGRDRMFYYKEIM